MVKTPSDLRKALSTAAASFSMTPRLVSDWQTTEIPQQIVVVPAANATKMLYSASQFTNYYGLSMT